MDELFSNREGSSAQKGLLKSPALLKYIFERSGYPKEHEQLKQLREITVQKYGVKLDESLSHIFWNCVALTLAQLWKSLNVPPPDFYQLDVKERIFKNIRFPSHPPLLDTIFSWPSLFVAAVYEIWHMRNYIVYSQMQYNVERISKSHAAPPSLIRLVPPPIGSTMSVPVDEAQFLSILLKIMNAKKTLEIGVFTGYSLLSTALALPSDGKIIGIDVDRQAYETGLPFIQKAGVEHKIDFIQTDALSALHDLINGKHEETFDYVFVDADKKNFIKYHELLLKLVKKGGIIAYDNTLWLGTVAMSENNDKIEDSLWQNREPTLEFNNYIANDTRIESTILSIADGVTLCRCL
ncbi:Flavonoid 3',5'-methyltransferase [Glycine soja]|uniref:Flavonoid 3',5'-methyltransferase n=1 Tax=Glycine soja TaxID=3848 RepID=A0A445JCS0_GLYSO|nr:Flavonoid 3',5'-methyltransferase [Glycine soja]